MPLNNTALNLMADALRGAATYIALHSADPGTTGANPTTAARVLASWPAATGSGDLVITSKNFTGGAANGAVTWVGLWSAATVGTFYGGFLIPTGGTNDLTFNAAGEYTLTNFTIDGSSV
jgi:hypothetical protein